MASILTPGTVSLQLRVLEEETSASSSGSPTDAVIFVGISLVLGIASRHALRGTRVPYTVALLVLGIGLGALEYGTKHRLGKIGDGIRLWANIDPDLLLAVFLPALLFESSFSMEVHQIKRCIMQMFLLAGPGVLISTFCLGAALKLAFPYNWSWKTSLLLGGLLSATDPVAVVALLKELGASKKLSTIIEGESLMNDGTAIVVYQLFYRMVRGWSFNWGAVIKFLTQVSLGAVGLGLAFGIASVLWLGFIFNDTVIEISLTLAVSYVAYFTAQEGLDVSGVLTVMTLGMFYSAVARTAFKGESQQSLHHFCLSALRIRSSRSWEMVAYIANTLIFILSGVVIAESILQNDSIFRTHEHSWGYLFLLYVFVQVARVVVVAVLFPFLQYFGYGLDWKEAIILVWSGLRGAVALSLSLSVMVERTKLLVFDDNCEVFTLPALLLDLSYKKASGNKLSLSVALMLVAKVSVSENSASLAFCTIFRMRPECIFVSVLDGISYVYVVSCRNLFLFLKNKLRPREHKQT
ncbi:UNVERIFIED_CONTAM: Sodium/hydrogen exchanger 7 [Sesamum radiatum]|uniref:Sodium/hydrogen exchanger 7 n=1 Tax=Sesamum radiatum TaxID=300843 RepID=A0AAW2JQW4_SESRA